MSNIQQVVPCRSVGSARNPPFWRSHCSFSGSIRFNFIKKYHSQMGIALVATGYWMNLDVPATPNAVVTCVIIFNAAFGYRFAMFISLLVEC